MHALDKAMKTLIYVIIIQWVMYLLFAITFTNLLVGKYKQICFQGEIGLVTGLYTTTSIPQDIPFCHSTKDCQPGWLCGK